MVWARKTSRHIPCPPLCCVLVLAFVASTSCAAGGVIEGPVAGRAVRSLGLRGGREQTAHRKAFEENKEAADVILRDWIKKEAQPPTALESLLADALYKQSTEDSMKFLKYLHIMSAREVTVAAKGERAIVIFVPFTEMKEYRKMCPALTETLEDQLKAHVFLVAHRRIIRKERRGKSLYKQKRPHSRTIAKVHEAYLDDVIWPQDVVGQKSVYAVAGGPKPIMHIYLDPAVRAATEHKMEAYRAVYENLTGKKVVFQYLLYQESSELLQQRTPNCWPCDTAGFLSYTEVKPAPLFTEGDAAVAPEYPASALKRGDSAGTLPLSPDTRSDIMTEA